MRVWLIQLFVSTAFLPGGYDRISEQTRKVGREWLTHFPVVHRLPPLLSMSLLLFVVLRFRRSWRCRLLVAVSLFESDVLAGLITC